MDPISRVPADPVGPNALLTPVWVQQSAGGYVNCTRTIRPWTWSVSGPRNVPSPSCGRDAVAVAARWFQDNFKGDVFYAVKANPSPWVIETLVESGVTAFDVASLPEIELVRRSRAGRAHGLHAPGEEPRGDRQRLFRPRRAAPSRSTPMRSCRRSSTPPAAPKDLNLIVRLAVSADGAAYSLSGKFGVATARGAGPAAGRAPRDRGA